MKLTTEVRVPIACPHPGCNSEDFDILMSHPFGNESKAMWVECDKCKHRFYTDKGAVPERFKKFVEMLKKEGK